jgi:hypothetical protein
MNTNRHGKEAASASPPSETAALTTPTSKPSMVTFKDVQSALRSDPTSAYQYLTHLPIDLWTLELMNEILASGTLLETGIEPLDLARNFIQHGLRDIEAMGGAADPGFDEATAGSAYSNGNGADFSSSPPLEFLLGSSGAGSQAGPSTTRIADSSSEEIPQGKGDRDAQTRAVKLLVLFLKNLLKKGLVADATDPAGLLFEIEEVCVRYIFVPEVRAFRRWVEGEDEIVDQESGQMRMGG